MVACFAPLSRAESAAVQGKLGWVILGVALTLIAIVVILMPIFSRGYYGLLDPVHYRGKTIRGLDYATLTLVIGIAILTGNAILTAYTIQFGKQGFTHPV
jgi:hypothetical protein